MTSRLDDYTKETWRHGTDWVKAEGKGVILKADRENPNTTPSERDSNVFLASFSPFMFDALIAAESALFYATMEGQFDSVATEQQIVGAYNEVKSLLDMMKKLADMG